jgi:hypothetical protein
VTVGALCPLPTLCCTICNSACAQWHRLCIVWRVTDVRPCDPVTNGRVTLSPCHPVTLSPCHLVTL